MGNSQSNTGPKTTMNPTITTKTTSTATATSLTITATTVPTGNFWSNPVQGIMGATGLLVLITIIAVSFCIYKKRRRLQATKTQNPDVNINGGNTKTSGQIQDDSYSTYANVQAQMPRSNESDVTYTEIMLNRTSMSTEHQIPPQGMENRTVSENF
ncbi:hypothetical protein AGIG_G2605 [Arapaima gigas]